MTQLTLYGGAADTFLMARPEGDAARTYRFRKRGSVANLVDQLALVTGRNKSKVVGDAIRLAALFVKLAGLRALEAIARCDDAGNLLSIIGASHQH